MSEMRIAYQIILHDKEWQFKWLFDALYNEIDLFAIHIDKKAPISTVEAVHEIAGNKSNVYFSKSLSVIYGEWTLCQIALDAIEYFVEHHDNWDFFINLSGQDYPLKTREQIVEELQNNTERNFIDLIDLAVLPPYFGRRIKWYCFRFRNHLIRTPIPRRKPKNFRINWHGSAWHILSRSFCEWVVSADTAIQCMAFLKHVKMPNEFLMQTLIMNSPFQDSLVPNYKRKIVWRRHTPHPQTLTMQHLPDLLNSDAFFARKFDARVDEEVLHALTRHSGLLVE